jgi:hypothetical protein
MVHGVCWGVGQSTLTRRLASAMPDADVLWEDELSQPAIFTRSEFAAVADRFYRHNANPDAGIGHPTARMLEDAYGRLARTVLVHGRTALMGWSVMDLAEDLDWARADEYALHRHARAVRDVVAPLNPVLVYIDGDVSAAFKRAVEQRGHGWFRRAYGRADEAEEWKGLVERLLDEAYVAAVRMRRALEAGGWFPAVEVDGTAVATDELFDAVAEHLRWHGVDLNP